MSHAEGVTPVIKRSEFDWTGLAHNIFLDDTTYYQRSNVESTFFALRRKYGEIMQAQTWFRQFRELVRSVPSETSNYLSTALLSTILPLTMFCLVKISTVTHRHHHRR